MCEASFHWNSILLDFLMNNATFARDRIQFSVENKYSYINVNYGQVVRLNNWNWSEFAK